MRLGKKLLYIAIGYTAIYCTLWVLIFIKYKNHLAPQIKTRYPQYQIYIPANLAQTLTDEIAFLKSINYKGQNKFNINLCNSIEECAPKNTVSTVAIRPICKACKTSHIFDRSKYIAPSNLLELKTLTFLPVNHLYSSYTYIPQTPTHIYLLRKDFWIKDFLSPQLQSKVTISRNIKDIITKLRKEEKAIAILPLEELTPKLKVLTLNSNLLETYLDNPKPEHAFLFSLSLSGNAQVLNDISNILSARSILSQPNEKILINSIIYTGVTAISRNLALQIEKHKTPLYPATPKLIKTLQNADYTHTSNEVSFVPGCVPQQSMRFCSDPSYFKLLQNVGIDIVELTGNHNNDYSPKWNAWSIQNIYKPNKIIYFGGGININDATTPRIIKMPNIRVGLLGYNYYDTIYNHQTALASPTQAGANPFYWQRIASDLKRLKSKTDIVFVSVQFQECYSYPPTDMIYKICYKPLQNPDQKQIFRKLVDLGADIVIGTQAHQPQTYEIYKNKFIFYGLGNLFFDQIYWIGTRQALALKFYFYGNKLINIRLIPLLQDKDFKQHLAPTNEGKRLLRLLKEARENM